MVPELYLIHFERHLTKMKEPGPIIAYASHITKDRLKFGFGTSILNRAIREADKYLLYRAVRSGVVMHS